MTDPIYSTSDGDEEEDLKIHPTSRFLNERKMVEEDFMLEDRKHILYYDGKPCGTRREYIRKCEGRKKMEIDHLKACWW